MTRAERNSKEEFLAGAAAALQTHDLETLAASGVCSPPRAGVWWLPRAQARGERGNPIGPILYFFFEPAQRAIEAFTTLGVQSPPPGAPGRGQKGGHALRTTGLRPRQPPIVPIHRDSIQRLRPPQSSLFRAAVALIVAAALSASVGRAETVVCNDGKSYSCAVTVTAHEAVCVSPGVKRTFALTTIKDVDLSGDEQIEFERRTQDLRALDAKALVGLALWLKSKHQHDRAQEHFTKSLAVDPNNAEARRELGFERKGGEWEYSPILHQRMMYDWVGRRSLEFHFDLAKKLHALGETALEEKELRRVLQADAVHAEAIAMLRPIVAKYPLKNRYRLPFVGRWAAVSGPNPTGHGDYSYMMNAFDFRRVDEQGRIASGDPRELKSYYTFEQPIYACADGEVYDVKGEFPDNPIGTIGLLEEGNRILIRHAGGERSVVGHLQKGSFKVKVGDKVKQGQILALLGNSGRSATPHLHFAIYDGDGVSLPMVFAEFDAVEGTLTRHVESGALEAGRIYENQFGETREKK